MNDFKGHDKNIKFHVHLESKNNVESKGQKYFCSCLLIFFLKLLRFISFIRNII